MSDEPRNRRSSDAEIDVVKLTIQYGSLASDMSDVKGMLTQFIKINDDRHAQLLATFNQHNLEDAVFHQKVVQIDTHLTATDKRVEDIGKRVDDAVTRDPVSFWTAVGSAAATAATIVYTIIHGTPPVGKP